jgi:hypothetical protein
LKLSAKSNRSTTLGEGEADAKAVKEDIRWEDLVTVTGFSRKVNASMHVVGRSMHIAAIPTNKSWKWRRMIDETV